MLSLLCLHEPPSERTPLASLVPSVQWGQLTISGCLGGGAVRAPDLRRRKRLGPGLVGGGACRGPVVCPSSPLVPGRPASLSCFCFLSLR